MRKPQIALAAVALALVVAAPAGASTPKQQVKAQKVTIAKLKAQLATAKTTITTLNGQSVTLTASFAKAQTDLATRTAERDTANASLTAQVALTSQAAAGAITGLSPAQLWGLIGAIYPLMPNSGLCGLSKTFYAGSGYTSYDFSLFIC